MIWILTAIFISISSVYWKLKEKSLLSLKLKVFQLVAQIGFIWFLEHSLLWEIPFSMHESVSSSQNDVSCKHEWTHVFCWILWSLCALLCQFSPFEKDFTIANKYFFLTSSFACVLNNFFFLSQKFLFLYTSLSSSFFLLSHIPSIFLSSLALI